MNINRVASSSAINQPERSLFSMRDRIVASFSEGAFPADYCYGGTDYFKCLLMMSWQNLCVPTDDGYDIELDYPSHWKILDD